jgi:transposase
MQVLYQICAGLEVHKRSVVACLLSLDEQGQRHKQVRTFSTMTKELLELADWLKQAGCTHLAMESTASYWKPVYNLLEGLFELVVVNAQHFKAVPGRKTDVGDAEWLADLLRHGLLRASFIPERPQRELRDLTRYRTSLVEERARLVNRLQKILEDTNLKLSAVITDITGVSGRAILNQLLAGEEDPVVLAELARGRLRNKRDELEQALHGKLKAHHRFMLVEQLAHLDYLDEALEQLTKEIEARLANEAELIERLDAVSGVNARIAQITLAEIGTDMSRFPSEKHLSSWVGLCPGNHESGGKRYSGRTRKGNQALRRALLEAAHAAGHSKKTYLGALYRRLAGRLGKKKAAVAVARHILEIMYHLIAKGEEYQERGPNYRDERAQERAEKRWVKQLEKLGYRVSLQKSVEPSSSAAP